MNEAGHYATVARAIVYIRAHADRQPGLAEIAAAVGMDAFQLQRVFSAWAGLSPKRFLQYLTKAHARQALRESAAVLDAALAAGLSGPGRLHDLMVSCEALTPGEIRTLGKGVQLRHGLAPTPFGTALFGWTARGICALSFCAADGVPEIAALHADWPAADFVRDDAGATELAARVFPAVPHAQRAAGSALAANRIACLIPCHRVIRASGESGIYRWGEERKLALRAWEAERYITASNISNCGGPT